MLKKIVGSFHITILNNGYIANQFITAGVQDHCWVLSFLTKIKYDCGKLRSGRPSCTSQWVVPRYLSGRRKWRQTWWGTWSASGERKVHGNCWWRKSPVDAVGTPWKINMEHNHRGLEGVFPFSFGWFFGSMLIFQGVVIFYIVHVPLLQGVFYTFQVMFASFFIRDEGRVFQMITPMHPTFWRQRENLPSRDLNQTLGRSGLWRQDV